MGRNFATGKLGFTGINFTRAEENFVHIFWYYANFGYFLCFWSTRHNETRLRLAFENDQKIAKLVFQNVRFSHFADLFYYLRAYGKKTRQKFLSLIENGNRKG